MRAKAHGESDRWQRKIRTRTSVRERGQLCRERRWKKQDGFNEWKRETKLKKGCFV